MASNRNEAIVVERYYIRGACMLKRKEERGRGLFIADVQQMHMFNKNTQIGHM